MASFYSIFIDTTTQNISNKGQPSEVYRYVNIIKNYKLEPISINIEEVFQGLLGSTDPTAIVLSTKI